MNARPYLSLSISLLTAFSLAGGRGADAAGTDKYTHLMEKGELLYFNGDVQRAIKAYSRASDLKPTAVVPHVNLANLYVQKGGDEALARAASECEQVLKLNPSNKEIHLIRSNLIRIQASSISDQDQMNAKLDEALREVKLAQSMGVAEDLCENAIGLTLLQKGDMDGALLHIDKALKRQPTFPDAHLVRGLLLFKAIDNDLNGVNAGTLDTPTNKKKLEEVFTELDLAINQGKTNSEAIATKLDILNVLFVAGKYDEALKHYQEVVTQEPGSADAWEGIARCATALSEKETDPDKKQEHIRRARNASEQAHQ